jgi:hypothetical protein
VLFKLSTIIVDNFVDNWRLTAATLDFMRVSIICSKGKQKINSIKSSTYKHRKDEKKINFILLGVECISFNL